MDNYPIELLFPSGKSRATTSWRKVKTTQRLSAYFTNRVLHGSLLIDAHENILQNNEH
jgi:hypothetical protein